MEKSLDEKDQENKQESAKKTSGSLDKSDKKPTKISKSTKPLISPYSMFNIELSKEEQKNTKNASKNQKADKSILPSREKLALDLARKIFDLVDKNHKGVITQDQTLKAYLKRFTKISTTDINDFKKDFVNNNKKKISFSELKQFLVMRFKDNPYPSPDNLTD